jgi:hypothetical protein
MGILLASTGLPLLTAGRLVAARAAPSGGGGTAHGPDEVPLQGPASSIAYRGVTFSFSEPVRWYRSANGDPVVISHADHLPSGTAIIAISPASTMVDGYQAHGAEINSFHTPVSSYPTQGFDALMGVGGKWSGHHAAYRAELNRDPAVGGPIPINPGDAFSVVKSVRKAGAAVGNTKMVEKYVVLTVMNTLPPRPGTWHRPPVSTLAKAWPRRPVEEMNLTGSGAGAIFRDLPKPGNWGNLNYIFGHNCGTSAFWNQLVAQNMTTLPSMWEVTWDPGQRFVPADAFGKEAYAGDIGTYLAMMIGSLCFNPAGNATEMAARENLAKAVIQWGIDCDGGHQRKVIHSVGAGQWYGYWPAYAVAAFALDDPAMVARLRVHDSNMPHQTIWVTEREVGWPNAWQIGSDGSNKKAISETYQVEQVGQPEWVIQSYEPSTLVESLHDPAVNPNRLLTMNASWYAVYRSTCYTAHAAEALTVGVLRNGPSGETGDQVMRRNAAFDKNDLADLPASSLAYVDRCIAANRLMYSGVGPIAHFIQSQYNAWRDVIPQARWTGRPDVTSSHDLPNFFAGSRSGEIVWALDNYDFATETIAERQISYSLDGIQFSPPISLGAGETTYTIAGLRPGTPHWCRWRQRSASGWSVWSPTWCQHHPAGTAAAVYKTDRGKVSSGGDAPATGWANTVAPALHYKPYPLHPMPYYAPAPASLADADAHGPGVAGVARLWAGIGYWTGGSGSASFSYDSDYALTGTGSFGATYQWQRKGSNISGATGQSYALQAADGGQSLRCIVTVGGLAAPSNAVSIP